MKYLLKILIVFLFVSSCKQSKPDVTQNNNLNGFSITKSSKEVVKTDAVKEQKFRWIQYKKVPIMDTNDTIPVKNCYLTIKSNVVSIYVDEALTEKHNLVRDNQYSFPSYYFEDKPDDILQYLDKEQSKLVIKRDNFDGIQEYYIKKSF